jgi:hypothetical protein
MKHLTQEELSARLDDAMAPAAAAEADRHLAACESCRDSLASLAARDDALGRVLEHDPGEAYFESFPARVEDRIRAAGLRGAQARAWEGGVLSWLRSPRRLAMAGVVAAVIGGAAIVIVTARMERPERALLESRPVARAIAPPASSQDQAAPSERGTMKDDQPARALGSAPLPQALAKRSTAAEEERKAEVSQAPPEPTTTNASPGRAMAAPRTDAGAGAAAQPNAGFAQPPAAPRGGTLASRKAAPAVERQSLARGESNLKGFVNPTPSADGVAGAPLCGRVVDTQGRPVVGAVVALADLGMTVQTDAQGGFCFSAPSGVHSIIVLAMGYQESRVEAGTGASTPLEVKLRPVPVLEGPMATSPSLDTREADIAGAFAGAPASVRSGVSEAQALFAKARVSGAAADYDVAARRWQRIVPGLTGASLQETRFRLAEARFLAWERGPNPARAEAANGALITFLRYANAGPHREQAVRWLARLLR